MRFALVAGLLACLVLAVSAFTIDSSSQSVMEAFAEFQHTYNKQYATGEETSRRFKIFSDHLAFIEKHNAEAARGLHTYTVGINQFADMSLDEFSFLVNGYHRPADRRQPAAQSDAPRIPRQLPSSVDWVQKGVVTAIKNQGQCGSCWSFSATGCMEGQHAMATGQLVSLSEQCLIDCSTAYGNEGCNGGLPEDAFKWVIAKGGDDTESSYPYTATGPNACKFNPSNIGSKLTSYAQLPAGNEDALQAASAVKGPISVGIDASHTSFQLYKSGVYYEPACSTTQLDHAVLVVGYGTSNNQAYWLVKNSWGTTWGMQGYIWMSRNRNNNCGIATDAVTCYLSGANATTATTTSGSSTSGPASSTRTSSGGPSGPASSGPSSKSGGPSGPAASGPASSGPASSGQTSGQSSGPSSSSASGQYGSSSSASGQYGSSSASGQYSSSASGQYGSSGNQYSSSGSQYSSSGSGGQYTSGYGSSGLGISSGQNGGYSSGGSGGSGGYSSGGGSGGYSAGYSSGDFAKKQ